jgi:hypothetical protein
MSFIWNWIKKTTIHEEYMLYQQTKRMLVENIVSKIKDGKLSEVVEFLDKNILLDALSILKDEKSKYFSNQEQAWKIVFEKFTSDKQLILFLLCFFAEELLSCNWNQDWSDFVTGKRIPYPYNLYMEDIRLLFNTEKYDALEKRFDFHQFWSKPISFRKYLCESCNKPEKKITIEFDKQESPKSGGIKTRLRSYKK